jgi:hypothetical protein
VTNDNDDFMQGGIPWATFKNVGDSITGTIKSEITKRQSRDFESGELATWDNGDPKLEYVVQLATDLRDPEVEFDDGTRQLVMPKGGERHSALRNAIRKAGASGVQLGGKLTLTCSGEEPNKKRGMNAKKLFSAVYEPPSASSDLMADDDQAMKALQESGLVS